MTINKRDGTKVVFGYSFIENAISKANVNINEKINLQMLKNRILPRVEEFYYDYKHISVEDIQDIVIAVLKKYYPLTEQCYSTYRHERELYRKKTSAIYSNTKEAILELINTSDRDRENSNSNTRYISTKRTEISKTLSKEIYKEWFLDAKTSQAVTDGYIYIHDLSDLLLPQYNCCLTNVANILQGGFEIENIFMNEPKTIRVAIGLLGDIIMTISAQHFGGNTTPQVDKVLYPYYKMDYNYKELKQSLQGLEAKLNTVVSARGSFPFTTFSFGDVSNKYEADIAKAILEVRMEGHGKTGKRKSLIFPKLVFLYNEEIHGEGKEYEWLFDLSVKCSSQCMYPDTISAKHYKRHGKWVSPMGCRAYLSDYFDENGEVHFEGRMNLGAISLNFPMIYQKSQQENLDFYQVLHGYLEMIRALHKQRVDYVGKAKASSNPLMFTQGGALGGYLKPNDEIAPLLKSATISFGITALHETTLLKLNKSLRQDSSFAHEILDYMNDYVSKIKQEDDIMYALYNTPAESYCGTARNQFVEKYGIIKGVSDKKYFTNSNHLWVGEKINPIEKQDKEIELFKKSMGGHIGYVRVSNPLNLQGLKTLIKRGITMGFYQGVNFNACQCETCGEQGNDMGHTCPACGSNKVTEINRTCGYLGMSRTNGDHTFNKAKMKEIKDRKSM